MTKLETFRIVRDHLLKQGKKSLMCFDASTASSRCAYRGEGGTKCAAGCLISDKDYRTTMEGESCFSVVVKPFIVNAGHDINLVNKLQMVHDVCDVSEWPSILQKIEDELCLGTTAS